MLDPSNEFPLGEASLYLGNFDAFRLMNCGQTPNDTTLHNAAILALPKFVDWLLDIHDPDYKAEEFDNMIPLALACASKPQSWCKIANAEADWHVRQKETMHMLAPITNPKWRARGKTVLHIALDNGLDATKSLIDALDISNDPEKDEKYLYMDKEGIEYSPHQFVMKLMDIDEMEKKALYICLLEAGMKSRYFKRVELGKGEQPKGYHGLPSELWGAGEE